MKLKLFLFPLTIIGVVAIFIWVIYPKFLEVKDKNALMKDKETELEMVKNRKGMVAGIVEELNANKDKKQIVFDFIPYSGEEENLINSINNFSQNSGVSITSLSFEEAKSNNKTEIETDANALKEDFASMKISFTGEYSNIKSFLSSVYKMKRMNNITVASIAQYEGDLESAGTVNILEAQITANFVYKPKIENGIMIANDVFANNKLDLSVVDKLNNFISSQAISSLEIGQTGKSNPFVR